MDAIETTEIIESRIVNTRDGCQEMLVVNAFTSIENLSVSITVGSYVHTCVLSDRAGIYRHRPMPAYSPAERKVGLLLDADHPIFGIECAAIELDGTWYALGTWNHFGKYQVVE